MKNYFSCRILSLKCDCCGCFLSNKLWFIFKTGCLMTSFFSPYNSSPNKTKQSKTIWFTHINNKTRSELIFFIIIFSHQYTVTGLNGLYGEIVLWHVRMEHRPEIEAVLILLLSLMEMIVQMLMLLWMFKAVITLSCVQVNFVLHSKYYFCFDFLLKCSIILLTYVLINFNLLL